MNFGWHFNQRRPCDRLRDSANDAFFTSEGLENLSEGLVREGIQNSLDASARLEGGSRDILVRIVYVPKATGSARDTLLALFQPSRNHFEKGLPDRVFQDAIDNNVGYLVFEDFGTRGLNGDTAAWDLDAAAAGNAFFSFFRAEGTSGKTGEKIGRWGIGKQVFPTASRVKAMFGLTVRTDAPGELAMGSAVIRNHKVGAVEFQPDSWFGCRDSEAGLVMPITDKDFLQEFKSTFELRRESKVGLSVVVPFVDDRIQIPDLERGVIRNFFWPILQGELVVEIEGPGSKIRIDAESISKSSTALRLPDASSVRFAHWAAFEKPADIVQLEGRNVTKPDWSTASSLLLPEEKVTEIRKRLDTKEKVGIRVPVRVQRKGTSKEQSSHFTVYIGKTRESPRRPLFLRDGIVITDVRAHKLQGVISLVVVDDAALAGLLGDSEGVNHTQWQKDSKNFHKRYTYGPETIKFVTRSVDEVIKALHAQDSKADPTLLTHLFYLPSEEGSAAPKSKQKPQPGPPAPPVPEKIPQSRPKKFVIQQVDGGFQVKPSTSPIEVLPLKLRIRAAYAVRRGDAIKRWAPEDFSFGKMPLRFEPKAVNVNVTREDGNCLELEIRNAGFSFWVCGFDKRRDLVLRATEIGPSNEENV